MNAESTSGGSRSPLRICLIHLERDAPTETFIRADSVHLPCQVSVVHGIDYQPVYLDSRPILRHATPARAWRVIRRIVVNRRLVREGDERATSI